MFTCKLSIPFSLGEIIWFQPEVIFFLCLLVSAVTILRWLQEDARATNTVWYTMMPIFFCCIHQMMYFGMCLANPMLGGAAPPETMRGEIGVAPPRRNLTLRRQEVRRALRGTNVIRLDTNWIMRRKRLVENVATMPEPPNIEGEKCSICLEPFNTDPEDINIGYLHKCGHIFHFDCVWRWIDERLKCPLCREGVRMTKDDMSLLSLSELRDLFRTSRVRTTSDAKSLKSVRSSSAACRVSFLPSGSDEENNTHDGEFNYSYEDIDREITRIFAVALPDIYPDNLTDEEDFPYVRDSCTLCMKSYRNTSVDIGYILPCMHFFHLNCIASWINQYNVCPHCPLGRRLLDDDDVYVMTLRDLLISLDDIKPWENDQ